ncbi:putative vitellogenin receptor isoform X2 [Maniola jurtina]|uniref:putative vitellogenin receptor isoform X2 n=1 Tax=Maniola jurtina TaxID=191418 RepID=UPI001E6892BF|nr:putative vitellogenin receptor isoform X2 [Maniola jurtina]
MTLLVIFISWLTVCSSQFVDEMQTYESECLVEGAFTCLAGGCVPQEKYCDGNYDCEDGSDENFCVNHRPDEQYCNDTHQFLCTDSRKCLPSAWVCNDELDCSDGSDEANCPTAAGVDVEHSVCKGFLCDGKRCISRFWMCDGYYDCDDKADEDVNHTCRHALHSKTLEDLHLSDISYCDSRGRYTCLDKSYCLPREHVCDGMNDCKDGSDEGAFCVHWHTMCENFTCPQNAHCRPETTGATCRCQYGTYNSTSKLCEESDACAQETPACSHMCVNKGDHFICLCDNGYTYDMIRYLCFAPDPEALLFFNTRNDIRYVSVKSKHQVIAVTEVKQAHSVSYDGRYLYWVETAQGHQAIMRARLDDVKDSKQVIAALGLEDPGDIAIDYLADNIYFGDAKRGVISACRSDGSVCTTLRTDAKHPRFVTLDPRQGKMYWVDWLDKEVIMQANMDGSGASVLVDNLSSMATGLALDAPNGRLYFVDQTIKVVRLDDKRVYSFFEEPFHHPYSLAVFENTVFWSDFTSNTIQTADKIHGPHIKRNILLGLDVPVFDMHIYHPLLMKKTVSNPCSKHDCTLCLLASNVSHVCACPDDMQMIGGRCQHIPGYRPQYLIVGAGSTFTRVHYDRIGNPETHGTNLDIGRVQAMAYDSIRDALYMYDSQRKAISHINMSDFTLGVTELLLYEGLENVVDMDYDFVSDTLYVLDAGRRVIEVVSLRNKHTALLYSFKDQEIPLSFCVMSDYGRMLVAVLESEENNRIHIDSMGLDGSNREHLLMNNIVGPNIRLRYSPEMNVVYIADDGNSVIDVIHPEGTGREMFSEVLTRVASLAVSDTRVFWTDRGSARLYWANVHEAARHVHQTRRMELSIFPNETHLHILTSTLPPDSKNPYRQHKCFQPPTPCSHICLQSPHLPHTNVSTMGYTCQCPPGFLRFDRCMEFLKCHRDEFICHKSVQCFPAHKKCDGVKNCKFGEDEEGCGSSVAQSPQMCPPDKTNCHGTCIPKNHACIDDAPKSIIPESKPLQCDVEEFRCSDNSVCIERSLTCDGHADCVDGSDEHPDACNVRSCFDTEFMCASGSCIPISWRCDSNEDCADGSDEVACESKACPSGSFPCGNGSCVPVYVRCDGKADCADHADEQGCDLSDFIEVSEHVITCSPWERPCEHNKSLCLPLTARCNGKVDCPGGTDEDGCDFHCNSVNRFPCKQENKCIPKLHVCNGRKDCADGSDETIEACIKVNKTVGLHPVHVTESCGDGYRCDSGQCVEWRQVCDNTTDCVDGSDEGKLCGEPCKYGTCKQMCHVTPRGHVCSCAYGYVAHGSTCRDVDECARRPCSHVCHNVPGSFVCACHRGYALKVDRRSCKAVRGRLSIIYTTGSSIWSITNHLHHLRFHSDEGTFSDLDVDVRNKKVYVTSSQAKKLYQYDLLSGQESSADGITNIGIPSKMALDWITGNVYFVDASLAAGCVRVCNFQAKRCATLQKLASDKVTALAIDPANRVMFYCVSGADKAITIVRWASLSGGNASDLVSASSCSALTVDSFSQVLYIASEQPSSILEVSYLDKKPKIVLPLADKQNVASPRDMALFEDHIYYLNNIHLSRCPLFGRTICEDYDHVNATNFAIRHQSVQRDDIINDCEANVCSNVCVLGQSGPECVCHDGSISSDGMCPLVKTSELALFNGWTYQEYKSHSVSYAMVAVVLFLFALYLCLFVYCHRIKKNRADNMQVRYKNTSEGAAHNSSPFIEIADTAGLNTVNGTAHEFVNPLQFVRNHWQESFYMKKPIGTAGLAFDTQQDLSDTESDLDVRETKRFLNNNNNLNQI